MHKTFNPLIPPMVCDNEPCDSKRSSNVSTPQGPVVHKPSEEKLDTGQVQVRSRSRWEIRKPKYLAVNDHKIMTYVGLFVHTVYTLFTVH